MLFDKILSSIDSGEAADVLTIIDSEPHNYDLIGKMLIVHTDGHIESSLNAAIVQNLMEKVRTTVWNKPQTIDIEDSLNGKFRVFWDRTVKKYRAIVLGGGHISQPLVQILALLDFEMTVIDDRPEFANQERFPGAQSVICESFQQALKNLEIDNDTAVIIVTRGHKYDLDCLRATMGSKARYLGMIGSRRRVREIIKLLLEEGAPEELEKRLKAPIGLDIKAETPAEIAVSIVAEVVSVFRGGDGQSLSR